MKKTNTISALVLASALFLTGCGANNNESASRANQGPQVGIVIDKEEESAGFDTERKCAKKVNGVCKQYKNKTEWEEAEYKLLVEVDGFEEWVEVDEDVYDSHEKGDQYTID